MTECLSLPPFLVPLSPSSLSPPPLSSSIHTSMCHEYDRLATDERQTDCTAIGWVEWISQAMADTHFRLFPCERIVQFDLFSWNHVRWHQKLQKLLFVLIQLKLIDSILTNVRANAWRTHGMFVEIILEMIAY